MQTEPEQAARATQTIGRVQEALRQGETAAITQVIELIETITAQSETISVAALSEVIARDLTTMFKVIRMANTLAFNPEGSPVTTISQAIQVVGFEKIRTLAVSLLLLENAERGANSEESRGVAAVALASGLVAQTLASRVPACDSEQAFVCAALRSYGKLLLTTFMLNEYRQAEARSEQVSVEIAYREVFGLTPEELGLQLLTQVQLPVAILDRLRSEGLPPSRQQEVGPNEAVTLTSELGMRICELIASPSTDATNLESQVINLARKYPQVAPQEAGAMMSLLREVNRRLASFGVVHGTRAFSSPFMRKFQRLSLPMEKTSDTPATAAERNGTNTNRFEEESRPYLLQGMTQLTELFAQDPLEMGRVWDAAANTIKSGLKLRSCWVLYQHPKTRQYHGHVPSGQGPAALHDRALLSGEQKSVFDVCLTRGEAVLIQNPKDPKIQPFLPDWFKPLVQSGAFILLPLRDRSGVFAVLCGHSESGDIWDRLSAVKQELKMFCQHLSLVRRLLT
jgi:HD-like signal output (HDOD) protein